MAAMYEQDADEPDPLIVAAYLLRSLCQNHRFVDGNKRVAWLAALEGAGHAAPPRSSPTPLVAIVARGLAL